MLSTTFTNATLSTEVSPSPPRAVGPICLCGEEEEEEEEEEERPGW